MKRMLFYALPLAVLLSAFASSCKKESTESAPVNTDPKLALLTKSVWFKSNEGLDSTRDGVIDVVDAHFTPCNADDRALFFGDGTLTWMEGPTKCNANGADSFNLDWHFVGQDGINMLGRDLKIFKLTETELSVYYEVTSGDGFQWEMMQFKR